MRIEIKTVGVIGAGQMGNGIAHVCSLAGFEVRLNDLSEERINAGLATINGNMARQVSKDAITEADRRAALARIQPARSYDDLSACDIVIEAATENEEVKRKIFTSLCLSLRARHDDRDQHLVDLDHPARRRAPTGRNASSASTS